VRQGRHQDEKPLAVTIPLVRECTPPGGVVVDPFAGTGTTGLAAKTVGRRAVLVEADEAMCETAARRLEQDQPLLCDETPLNGVAHNQQDLFGVE
jgi:site-specific DNA-methyltransferase (adenine-specific)